MKRVRAIIIKDKKILIIKRTKSDQIYWVFPGGGVEVGESDKKALLREGKEELGLILSVKELLAELKSGKLETIGQIENFYYCEIMGGKLGSGHGHEFNKTSSYVGSYEFELVNIFDLSNYDLRPVEIKNIIIKKFV